MQGILSVRLREDGVLLLLLWSGMQKEDVLRWEGSAEGRRRKLQSHVLGQAASQAMPFSALLLVFFLSHH